MTVSRLELCQVLTNDIAKLSKYYPTKIHVPHHQLRRFISTSEKDRIYYATDNDISILDLQRQQSTLLATVSFSIRCLAANHGWLCVGGESDGQCAFMKIEQVGGFPKCFGYDLNEKKLGGEIVNSMNIQIMSNHGDGEDEPIVLISNNDKTVKQYSLMQREVVATLEHDVPMNYAAMSPDCNIIASVGDCERIFFARRCKIDGKNEKARNNSQYPEYSWQIVADPVVPTGEPVYDDYGFAISFSPSGHLCAASSQGGAITVFDMFAIQDSSRPPESAIICSFRSSRSTLWGCVRAMEFSPEPWDLLAWAEDHGRVGIADLRHNFVRRQTLDLNKTKADIVKFEDATPACYKGLGLREKLEQQNLVRLRSTRGPPARGSRVDQLLTETRAEASQRRQSRSGPLSYHHGLQLDARERSILEALEITMDDVETVSVPPYSVNYSSSPRLRPSVTASEATRESDVNSIPRFGPRAQQPRRRTSVVLSDPGRNRNLAPLDVPRGRISASPGRMTDDEDVPPLSTHEPTSSTEVSLFQPMPSDPSDANPWRSLGSSSDNIVQATSDDSIVGGDRPTTLNQLANTLENEIRIGDQLHRHLNSEQRLTDLLRHRLETQERLLQSQQRNLEGDRENNGNSESSLERLPQLGFASDRRLSQQRSQELELELQRANFRARQLEAQRARLLSLNEQGNDRMNSSNTSAQTTTLPTMNVRQGEQSDLLTLALENHESFRTGRLAHIQDLEEQLRSAESQVVSATSDVQALEQAMHQDMRTAQIARESHVRTQFRARSGTTGRNDDRDGSTDRHDRDDSPWGQFASRRAAITMNSNRSTEARRTELSGGFSDAELQLARMMYRSRIRAMDANGNWDATAIERVLGHTSQNSVGTMSLDELEQEMGVGTAGVGWSPDGQYL